MGDLVSDCQGAFVPGRSMSHNSAVAREVVKGYGRGGNAPRCTLKVDLHKAFDCISWRFLCRVLVHFNFPPKMVDLIMELLHEPFLLGLS